MGQNERVIINSLQFDPFIPNNLVYTVCWPICMWLGASPIRVSSSPGMYDTLKVMLNMAWVGPGEVHDHLPGLVRSVFIWYHVVIVGWSNGPSMATSLISMVMQAARLHGWLLPKGDSLSLGLRLGLHTLDWKCLKTIKTDQCKNF